MHYSVLVVGEDVEAALAPFREKDGDNLPREWLAFVDREDEYRQKYENESTEKIVTPDGRLLDPWDERFKVKKEGSLFPETEIPEHLERRKVPYRELYPTFEAYMEDWCGEERDVRTGRYGYWHNPKGKWDWYQIGGRWNGSLALKPGATSGRLGERARIHPSGAIGAAPLPVEPNFVDSALKRDVDFAAMEARSRKRTADDYHRYLTGTEEDRKRWFFDEKDWPPHESETVEMFVERHYKPWCCYAFLGRDGVWHERSTWTGKEWIEAANWENDFRILLSDVADDERITVVDIHN